MVVDRRGETAEADVALSEVFEDQHELFQRPRQAVQLLDRQHVAPAHVVERLGEFRAMLLRAGRHFLIEAFAARGLESVELQGRVLVEGGGACVTDEHCPKNASQAMFPYNRFLDGLFDEESRRQTADSL